MPVPGDAEETTGLLSMSGEVTAVLSPTRIRARLTPTTDRVPAPFVGRWIAVLELHPGVEYPWILTDLRRAPGGRKR
jgi:hypothetical protein